MIKKILKAEIALILLISIIVGGYLLADNAMYKKYSNLPAMSITIEKTWYNQNNVITHATGGINGSTYTNSKESLENSLNNGAKVIEIDYNFTSDGHLVCYHMPKDVHILKQSFTLDDFLNTKVQGQYTPLTFQDTLRYLEEHEDLFISIDTKHEKLEEVIKYVIDNTENKKLLNRFLIQCFYPGEKTVIEKLYDFPQENYIFAPYKYSKNAYVAIQTCYDEGFKVLAADYTAYDKKMMELITSKNIYLFLHTVNRLDVAQELLDRGAYGIYSDFIYQLD